MMTHPRLAYCYKTVSPVLEPTVFAQNLVYLTNKLIWGSIYVTNMFYWI